MSLEAQEIAVRVRLLGGTAFEAEAARAAGSIEGIGAAGKKMNAEMTASADAGAAGGLMGFLGNSSKALDTVQGKLNRMSKTAHQVGRQTMMLSLGAGALMYASIKERMETEANFTRLETMAGATHKQREALEKAAPSFSKFGMSVKEVSSALYPIQSDFKNTTKDLEVMKATAEGTFLSLGNVKSDEMSKTLTSAYQAHFKDIKTPQELMSLLVKTGGEGKSPFSSIVTAFNNSLMPTAKSVNMPMRDILSSLAAASKVGNEPEFYSTLLRTALIKAFTVKGAALGDAKKLGFSGQPEVAQMMEGSGGLIHVLQRINKALDNAGPKGSHGRAEAEAWVADMFGGSRSYGTIATLLATLPYNEKILGNMQGIHSGKQAEQGVAQAGNTLYGEFHQLSSKVHNLLQMLGKSFGPYALAGAKMFVGLLEGAGKIFEHMSPTLKKIVGGFIGFVAILSPGAFILAGVFRAFSLLLSPIGLVFKGLGWVAGELSAGGFGGALLTAEGGLMAFAGPLALGAVIAMAGYAAYKMKLFGDDIANTTKADKEAHRGYRSTSVELKNQELIAHSLLSNPLGIRQQSGKEGFNELTPFNKKWLQDELRAKLGTIKELHGPGADHERAQLNEALKDMHIELDGHVVGKLIVPHLPAKPLAKKVNQANREHSTRG